MLLSVSSRPRGSNPYSGPQPGQAVHKRNRSARRRLGTTLTANWKENGEVSMHKEIKNSGAAAAASDQAIKRNASPAGEFRQIRYTAKEVKIIRSIAEALRTVEKAGDKIGKLVDELVAVKGGIEYGGETIERIASHPDINCSAQHLRKCWNLYRFTSAYGYMISPEHKKVCRAAMYQIARLLDL